MKKKLSNTHRAILAAGAVLLALIGMFQNCSGGFAVDPNAINAATQLASGGVAKVAGVANTDFRTCRAGTAPLGDCLESMSQVKGVLKAADVTRCTTPAANSTTAPTDLDVAMCLTKSGFPIFNYREPIQFDIDGCSTKVGTGKIAACLQKNALLPSSVTQAVIDACIGAVGMANVEKCLRKNNHIAKVSFLSNADVALCSKVTEQGTNGFVLHLCLANRELIPATVVQVDIDTCITNAPTTIARCLRTARKIPRVIMQANITGCFNAVGPSRIAACLESNGYLYDSLLPAATLQGVIDQCVAAAGPTNIARCLRTRDVLERPVMQAHIAACNLAAGTDKIAACLAANGMIDANNASSNTLTGKTLVQTEIDACVTNVGVGSVATCLAGPRQILNPLPNQRHFAACHRFNDPTGIAACLTGSGILPTGVTQANFDTCLAAGPVTNLETCMRTRGFIQ